MKYNIIDLADLHWGVIDPALQYSHLEQVFEFIREFTPIHLIVISGDYFDSRLPLNSAAAITAVQWFHELLALAKERDIVVRAFRGTFEHDNNQLEVFRPLEDAHGLFKLFNECTYEETLPGLKCIYCPDENINTEFYYYQYAEQIANPINIGFFHGSFDVVLPEIVREASEKSLAKSVIFEYNFWEKFIDGPMLAGHWHDGVELDHLIYVGSFERWEFGQDVTKGFGFVQYDTETSEYMYRTIPNMFAIDYRTFTIDTRLFKSLEDYTALINEIKEVSDKDPQTKIRIVVNQTDDKPDNESFVKSLKQYFTSNKNTKIVLKNKMKNERKKIERKKNIDTTNQFGFILDKVPKQEIIRQFIMTTKSKELSIEAINDIVAKYLPT